MHMAYAARVLVIASVTSGSDDLLEALLARVGRSPATFHLLLPAGEPGIEGRETAEPRLAGALARWREAGLEVAGGEVGDADPVLAVSEAWNPRAFDEIIVSTLPGHTSKWMRFDLPHRVAKITDCQVTHVVSRPPGVARELRSDPPRERPALGPLSVLAWGKKHP